MSMDPHAKQSPATLFSSNHYVRHNEKRLQHLASLGLDLSEKTVLELGAGIGDHTGFFLQRDCEVVSVEARLENLDILKKRYPTVKTYNLDLDQSNLYLNGLFDVVYCYGLLYHLSKPSEAIEFMAHHCKGLLLLETCISFGEDESVNLCEERIYDPTQSFTGIGCRPTRRWVFSQLKKHFNFVYIPITQPDHEEFPTEWSKVESGDTLSRSVFIGSKFPINNSLLVDFLPTRQFSLGSPETMMYPKSFAAE